MQVFDKLFFLFMIKNLFFSVFLINFAVLNLILI